MEQRRARALGLAVVGLILTVLAGVGATAAAEPEAVRDPRRPLTEITPGSFTIQYFTAEPAETRVQVRSGGRSAAEMRGIGGRADDPWSAPGAARGVREVRGEPGVRTFHRVTIDGLAPGERHFYRAFDPADEPGEADRGWAAGAGWRREFAVSTLAGAGEMAVVRLPVKVLVMPNVVDLASAAGAPEPAPLGERELAVVRRELNDAATYLFVNSGFRVWFDFEYVVDARWQRWGGEPARGLPASLRGLPLCRSWSAEAHRKPGGGVQTFVDARRPERVSHAPIVEADPFVGQIEIAMLRRWNGSSWELVESGGGTYGADEIHLGHPGRSQFLGGGDLAWLAAHELHHQLEAIGRLSLSHREDDRIVYCHHTPRRRTEDSGEPGTLRDAEKDGHWSTAGPHGTHWDGMAYWLRETSDAQFLRLALGETVVVADRDGDGVPDHDDRLPIDEVRFGSDPYTGSTDGRLPDFEKIRLSTWAPAPLQSSWIKPRFAGVRPDPRSPDSDGDGLPDGEDPLPLVAAEPFVWPVSARADGEASEWAGVPTAGEIRVGSTRITLRQGADAEAFVQCWEISGPVVGVHAVLDGEGEGFFGAGVVEYTLVADGRGGFRANAGGAPGLTWASGRRDDGTAVIEVRIANGADGGWFWRGGGREISASVLARTPGGAEYAMWEPYRPVAFTMLDGAGGGAEEPGQVLVAERGGEAARRERPRRSVVRPAGMRP